jgi:formate hydrogenlyase subunit 3/multisubunit Na+/H+ antiporter MnhD subunit
MNPNLRTTLAVGGTVCILSALALVAYTVHKVLPLLTDSDSRLFDRLAVVMIFGGGFSLMTIIIGVCLIVVGVKYGESLPRDRS